MSKIPLPTTCQQPSFCKRGETANNPCQKPSLRERRGFVWQVTVVPLPRCQIVSGILAGDSPRVHLSISPSRYPTKQMTNSCSSEADIIQMADPALIRWPTNTTAILKRAVSQGSERFWAKRGMAEPKERFVPTQFPKGREGATQ